MSAEQPISRVNYFNGQRLEATDFRADQDYQIAVRRKLYSALYSVGIVQGLEVTKHPTDPHKVVVAPGVALDFLGREIILLDPAEVISAGTPTTNPVAIFGNYLVIAYAEQRVLPVSDGCSTAGTCGGNLAWGAATRIVAQPALRFTDTYPAPQSGQIVLAQVALQSGCQVGSIESGIRQYAVAAKPPTTRPFSLEGEKDIDHGNPKTLYFHIDGGVPNNVTLYLRAANFSTLFYTELGAHTHGDASQLNAPNLVVPAHHHALGSIDTGPAVQDPANPVKMLVWSVDTDWNQTDAVRLWGANPDSNFRDPDLLQPTQQGKPPLVTFQNLNAHSHSLNNASQTEDGGQIDQSLGISFTPASAGLTPAARNAAGDTSLSYVDKMEVWFDGTDITQLILTQLAGNDPTNWPLGKTLGDGSGTNPMVVKGDGTGGTGPIALEQLGLLLSVGQHSLMFKVSAGGGQVQYNLYVE